MLPLEHSAILLTCKGEHSAILLTCIKQKFGLKTHFGVLVFLIVAVIDRFYYITEFETVFVV